MLCSFQLYYGLFVSLTQRWGVTLATSQQCGAQETSRTCAYVCVCVWWLVGGVSLACGGGRVGACVYMWVTLKNQHGGKEHRRWWQKKKSKKKKSSTSSSTIRTFFWPDKFPHPLKFGHTRRHWRLLKVRWLSTGIWESSVPACHISPHILLFCNFPLNMDGRARAALCILQISVGSRRFMWLLLGVICLCLPQRTSLPLIM